MPWAQLCQATAALIRLVCLYGILSYLGVELAITLREIRETDPLAAGPAVGTGYSGSAPATPIPFLGVTVELEQYNTPSQRQEALQHLRSAGFGWARQRFDWGRLEPQPGEFHWQWADAVLRDIIAAGLVPVVMLDGSPAWARDVRDRSPQDNPLAPPARPETYARFAAAFAGRYQDIVRFYQIWDEPNIAPHWGNRLIDPIGYALLLQKAAVAVRTADPDAVILAAALAPTRDRGHRAIDEGYFLQRLYAANAGPYFDVVLVQPFGFGTGPDDLRSRQEVLNFRRAAWVRRVMVAAGDGQTPVWAVRFGWNRQANYLWKTVSPANQVRFTEEALQFARANWPWLMAMGWVVDQPNAPPSDPLWGFALGSADAPQSRLLTAMAAGSWPVTETPQGADHRPLATGFSLLFAGLVVLWRGTAAVRLLPLTQWQATYRGWSQARKFGLWAVLLFIYYLATWPPLVVLCWLLAAFLIAAEPLVGLMIAAAGLPFHFQHKELRLVGTVWAVPPAQAALLATLPALISQWRAAARHWPRTMAVCLDSRDRFVLAWLGISLLTSLNVWHWPGFVSGFWELVLVPSLLYVGVRFFAADPRGQQHLLLALLAGGVLAAALGLIDWLAGGGVSVDGVRRLMGLSFSPNQTALYLLRTLFISVGLVATAVATGHWPLACNRRLLVPGYWLLATVVVALALLLTASRGAIFLGLPAGALVVAMARRQPLWKAVPRHRGWLPLAALLAVVVGLLVLFSGERLLNSETLGARLEIWRGALRLWQHHLLLGVGPGGFFWNNPAFQPSAAADPNLLHPHSVWLEYATSWGGMGMLWLGALLSWLFRKLKWAWSGRVSWLQVGLLAALCAGLAHAQVDAFAALPELASWNFIALALLTPMENG